LPRHDRFIALRAWRWCQGPSTRTDRCEPGPPHPIGSLTAISTTPASGELRLALDEILIGDGVCELERVGLDQLGLDRAA
jgi:hypothetical protein